MAGLVNKSLPFSSDGFYLVAGNLSLPINSSSSTREYIFNTNHVDKSLHVGVRVLGGTIIQANSIHSKLDIDRDFISIPDTKLYMSNAPKYMLNLNCQVLDNSYVSGKFNTIEVPTNNDFF